MTPNVWLLLLMVVLGAALTWFARVRTVRREMNIVADPRDRQPARSTLLRRGHVPPRRVEMDDDDGIVDPDLH